MKETGYRAWVEKDPEHKKRVSRAKRLARPYRGLDRAVERIKQYEDFLRRENGGKKVSEGTPEDVNAFVAWCVRKKIGAEMACRGTIVGYYRFLGNETLAQETKKVKPKKDWWQDLIRKRALNRRLSYGFVKEYHDLTMDEAIGLLERWNAAVMANRGNDWVSKLKARLDPVLKALKTIGVGRVSNFVALVPDQASAEALSKKIDIELSEVKTLLKWIDWHFLPEQKHLGVLFDKGNLEYKECVSKLAKKKLANNLALLDTCRTQIGRSRTAKELGIPRKALTSLVHRADMSRHMCIARTVEYFTQAGFPTFRSVKECDPEQFCVKVAEAAKKCGVHKVNLTREFLEYTRVFPEVVED